MDILKIPNIEILDNSWRKSMIVDKGESARETKKSLRKKALAIVVGCDCYE